MRRAWIGLLHALHRRWPGATRTALACLYPFLSPRRALGLPVLWTELLRHRWSGSPEPDPFPPVERARRLPDGLLAVGGSLTTARLLAAYRDGIYPWSHLGPVQWRAPAERMALRPGRMHIGSRLRTYLRGHPYRVSFDESFPEVIRACAAPRRNKRPLSWIRPGIIRAYERLFIDGHAHSVEVWLGDELVGGLYGVAIGRVFFTESLFTRRPNASRIGLTYLNCALDRWGYVINDFKRHTDFWQAQGARRLPRDAFHALLVRWRDVPGRAAPWQLDPALDVAGWLPGSGDGRRSEPAAEVADPVVVQAGQRR